MLNNYMIQPTPNTVKGWETASFYSHTKAAASKDQIVFQIIINSDYSDDSRNIMNLRYFFPICNDLEFRQKEYKVNILFNVNSSVAENNWEIKDLERIVALLSYILPCPIFYNRENHTAWFSSYGYKENTITNDVDPNITDKIIETAIDIAKATCLNQKTLSESRINTIFDSIEISPTEIGENRKTNITIIIGEINNYKEYVKIMKALDSEFAVSNAKERFIFHYICRYSKTLVISDIFPLLKIDDPEMIDLHDFIDAYEAYFDNAKNYIGTRDQKLSAREKTLLKNQLLDRIRNLILYENNLSKTIFFFMLRNYLQRKEIFIFNVKDEIEINYSVIDKLFADAKTYAEGVYQILENSCFYSCGKCAYFGMRIHNANRNATMSAFRNESQTLLRLYNKYQVCLNDDASNIFNSCQYEDYLELFVLDNASDGIGMIPNYNSKINLTSAKAATDIKELFEETEESYLSRHSDVSEYYLSHYGLRWFKKIITKNNGYIIVISPSYRNVSVYTGVDNKNKIGRSEYIPHKTYYTESNILVPLSYAWQNNSTNDIIHHPPMLFGSKVQIEEIHFNRVDIDAELIHAAESKSEAIKFVYQIIILKPSDYLHIAIAQSFTPSHVELLAKALFYHIFQSYRKNSSRSLYIVLDFNRQKNLISEFVRIFSVFYDKIGKNTYMSGVQIALASDRPVNENDYVKEINFILGGIDYDSAYATANIFLYYNSKSTAPFIPLLKYLTRNNDKAKQAPPSKSAIDIFPFDLYMMEERKSWFIRKMDALMNNDIRNLPYGCKINNTHICINSRIHLNTFFEAELLFHNVSIVYRFAYLIARQIVDNIQTNAIADSDRILIVGYENYSAILIQQVSAWVKNTCRSEHGVNIAIIMTNDAGIPEITYCDSDSSNQKTYCYSIIPIGTTFSTIYRLHRAIRRQLTCELVFMDNFTVISVCDENMHDGELNDKPLVYKYWKSMQSSQNTITLQPETSSEDGSNVKYIILAISKWYDVTDCEICNANNLPLIQADKTATLPGAIFELSGSNRQFMPSTDNLQLFEPQFNTDTGSLNVMVYYSHLFRGNNHYQFYFQFQEFVNRYTDRITKWAKTLQIDYDAYNIVVSPLSISNAKFLKIILDNVFSSSLRLLHIDINKTYKEDIRSKFSYISSDYTSIKHLNKNSKIHFYYIDDSIVTGQSINRGRMFLQMLIDESNLNLESPFFFKKIILLINRSSYDTVNTLVENVSTDFHAFCNLSIPSYNTNSNFCPGCAIQTKYELLKKRSASAMLRFEFDRLAKKQRPRTPEDYESWLRKQINDTGSYFSLLREHLYSLPEKTSDFESQLRDQLIDYLNHYYLKNIGSQDVMTILSHRHKLPDFLNSFSANKDYCEKVEKYVLFLIAKRAYLRLYTMNSAYERLQALAKQQSEFDSDTLNSMTKEAIWQLLSSSSDNDTVISYIKVISREHLSTYYHIKRAAMEVLTELLDAFIGSKGSKNRIVSNIAKQFEAKPDDFNPKRYQAVVIIIHRLAMLQSSSMLNKDTILKVVNYLNRESDSFIHIIEEYAEKNPKLLLHKIPSKEQQIKQYVKSLKITTMLERDDKMCDRLLRLYEEIEEVTI